MDFGPLRDLVRDLNFTAHGVAATITIQPQDGPEQTIETTVIWTAPLTEDMLGMDGMQSRQPRRVMAVRKDEVPSLPRGSIVTAPPRAGEADARWKVDGIDRVEADHIRVVVVPDAEPY